MASGTKQIVVPTNQRLLSSDINRSQRFQSADMAELLNYLLLAATLDDVEANGTAAFQTVAASPLFGMVINGLTFQPGVATANANVSQGLMVVVDPDSSFLNADDSPIKYVRADTVSANLTLTPNSSGSTRIDIVEVQRANTVIESTLVDMFDTGTGYFTPSTQTKVIQSTLNYRIRTGANGGGWPGTATEWLPIAVCSVPTGTTTWDTVDVWDVRPFIGDHAHSIMNMAESLSKISDQALYTSTANTTDGSILYISGYTNGAVGAWRVGGAIRADLSGGVGQNTNLMSSKYIEPSTTFSANAMYAVYLALPYGLPRWVRYSESSFGSRKPYGHRGFPILSTKIPTEQKGGPPSNLTMPTGFGFNGSNISAAVCVAAGYATLGAGSNIPDNMIAGKIFQRVGNPPTPVSAANTGVLGSSINWALTSGTHFPGNARLLRVLVTANITWASGYGQFQVLTFDQSTSHSSSQQLIGDGLSGTGGSTLQFEAEIPVWPAYPSNDGGARTIRMGLNVLGTAAGVNISATLSDHTIQVMGWSLGP